MAEDMAFKFERRIKRIEGSANTKTTIFLFKDSSRLKFDLMQNTNAQATGGKESDANKFASGVKTFNLVQNGFEFVFKDDSKMSYKFE